MLSRLRIRWPEAEGSDGAGKRLLWEGLREIGEGCSNVNLWLAFG